MSWYQNVNNTTSVNLSSFRNFKAIFAPSNSYFTEKSRWVPLKTTTSSSCIYTVLRK